MRVPVTRLAGAEDIPGILARGYIVVSLNYRLAPRYNWPAQITDVWAVPGANSGEIKLSWQTPGDDGMTTSLPSGSSYYIQYSSWAWTAPASTWSITSMRRMM